VREVLSAQLEATASRQPGWLPMQFSKRLFGYIDIGL